MEHSRKQYLDMWLACDVNLITDLIGDYLPTLPTVVKKPLQHYCFVVVQYITLLIILFIFLDVFN